MIDEENTTASKGDLEAIKAAEVASAMMDKLPKNGDGDPIHLGSMQWYEHSIDSWAGPHEIEITAISADRVAFLCIHDRVEGTTWVGPDNMHTTKKAAVKALKDSLAILNKHLKDSK